MIDVNDVIAGFQILQVRYKCRNFLTAPIDPPMPSLVLDDEFSPAPPPSKKIATSTPQFTPPPPAVRRKYAPGSLRAIEIFRAVEEPLHLHLPSAGNAAPVRRRTFHRFPAKLRARPEPARPLRHNRKAWLPLVERSR